MRILEIIPQLHMGGAEAFTVNLCNELSKQGHEVILAVTNPVSQYGHFAQYLSPTVRLISMDKKAGADPKLFFRLPKLIADINPDVVHTHLGAILYNVFSPFIFRKVRYYHTIHNEASKEATTGGWISAWARKFLFRLHKIVPVAISESSKQSFRDYYRFGCNPVLIENGVPILNVDKNNAPEIKSDKISLVNVARVMPQKNQMALVKAVEELNVDGWEIELYIIGYNDTPEGDAIKTLAPKHSHLLGPKNNPRDYMAAADAFVLSSVYEGMPLTLIESMAVGVPSICTSVGGIVNMIEDGKNGILVNGTSKDDIKDAIKRFLYLSKAEKIQMASRAHQSYNRYSMTRCATNYINLFNSRSV